MRRAWLFLCWMFDLLCMDGQPDYAKMMQSATQFALLGMLWLDKEVPFTLGLALIISAHGTRVLMAALKSGVFRLHGSVLETRSTSRSEVIERRDPDLAIDPTP